MMRDKLAQRLRLFRERSNMTIYAVGEQIGKSGKTVSAWENGRGQPDADMLHTLKRLYRVDSIAMFFGEEPPAPSAITEDELLLLDMYRDFSDTEKGAIEVLFRYFLKHHAKPAAFPRGDVIELPLPVHTASAGHGSWADSDDSAQKTRVLLTERTRKADFLFRVSGDSMEPVIPDGSVVAVRAQSDVPQEKIGLFFSRADGYFIKLRGETTLNSYNPAYPPIQPPAEGFECRGLVLGVVEPVD